MSQLYFDVLFCNDAVLCQDGHVKVWMNTLTEIVSLV